MFFPLPFVNFFPRRGGPTRHNRAYRDIAVSLGSVKEHVFELKAGDVLEFRDKSARIAGNVPTKEVLVDGLGIGDVGNVVLRDRKLLATDGIAIALIQIDRKGGMLITEPVIFSRGFVYEAKTKDLLKEAAHDLERQIRQKDKIDKNEARIIAIDFLEKFFYKKTGRRPMILPLIVEA